MLVARLLPAGWGDLLRQVAVFCGAYYAYRLARGLVVDQPDLAVAHARDLLALERALGLDVELALTSWAGGVPWVEAATSWAYVTSHFAVTTTALAWVYLRRRPAFGPVRDRFVVAMALALVLYVAYPTAPPRLTPGLGFPDPVAEATGVPPTDSGLLVNPYAAVPSMHVAFALMLATTVGRMVRRRWARALWAAYPAAVTFVVVATANHWVLDAVAGALVAGASAALATRLSARPWPARVRPPRVSTRRSSPTGSSSRG